MLKDYRLLFSNGYTVSEIAYKVGFESPSYFNKCFKEAFGVPPGDIRRNGERFSLQDKPIFKFYKTPKLYDIFNSRWLTLADEIDEITTAVPHHKNKAALIFLSLVAMLAIGFITYLDKD